MTKTWRLAAIACAALMATPAVANAAKYDIDPGHSTVIFRTKHFNVGYLYGRFRAVTGKIVINAKKPKKSRINLKIDATSIYTADKKRDMHLQSPDFLDTKKYPKITFKSTKVKKTDSGYDVTGKLKMHGKTKKMTIAVNATGAGPDPYGNERVGFDATFTVKRSEFGMDKMPNVAGDEITLMLAVEGIKVKKGSKKKGKKGKK